MIRIVGLLLVLAISDSARAEIVRAELRTLEGSSSRLQLGFWPENGWIVQQFANLAEIRFPGVKFEIEPEISEVFGLLEATSEVRSGDTYLRLTLDCECSIALTGEGEESVSIEILNNPRSRNDLIAVRESRGPAPGWSPVPTRKPNEPTASSPVYTDVDELDVDEARERLLEQLLKAAEAGIVNLEDPKPEAVVNEAETAVGAIDSDDATDVAVETSVNKISRETLSSRAGSSSTGLAQDRQQGTSEINRRDEAETDSDLEISLAEEPICYSPDAFDFPHINSAQEFMDELSSTRAALVGEFDQPAKDAVIAQAKLFISLGLAQEARAVVQVFALDDPSSSLYLDIADLMLLGQPREISSLGNSDCIGDQAIWRAYLEALQGNGEAALEHELASGRSLDRMPLYLRQLIASEIGVAYADAGKWKAARRLEAIAQRAARSADNTFGSTSLLSAKLADWNGTPGSIDAHLRDARSDPMTSEAATFEVARRWLRNRQPPGLDLSGLTKDLATIARRERGTEVGREAFELEARLWSETSTHDELVELLSYGASNGLIGEAAHAALLSGLIAANSKDETTQPLAIAYLNQPDRYQHALGEEGFRRALARSMAEIGTPELAKPLLRDGDLEDLSTTLALTESFLETGQIQESFDLAASLPHGEARQLAQAAAMLASGQIEPARDLLLEDLRDSQSAKLNNLMKRLRRKALADGQHGIALEVSEALLSRDEDLLIAEHAAVLALELGHSVMPPNADRVLRSADPERHADLVRLYRPVSDQLIGQDSETVSGYLSELDAEMNVIREILEDG